MLRRTIESRLEDIWYGGARGGALLVPLSWLYRIAFAVHRRRRLRARRTFRSSIPVVVVGNLTVGGTGKTPLVLYLAEQLRRRGYSPAIVSRGYGARSVGWVGLVSTMDDAARVGDEPLLLARRSGCPVVIGADRRAAVAYVIAHTTADVVLSDDGLQHHALPRDFEIAVIDGARGLGNGRCLPAGPLREPADRLDTVDAIVVNGPGWSSARALHAHVRAEVATRLADGVVRPLKEFAGQRVHAVAGIGHPRRFFDLLERSGVRVDAHPREDHAALQADDLVFADRLPVFITEKDAVKLPRMMQGEVWVVRIDLSFDDSDSGKLLDAIEARINEPR